MANLVSHAGCAIATRGQSGWRAALDDAVRDAAELCRLVGIDPALPAIDPDAADFPVLAPREYIARIRPGDPADPLLVQVLPQMAEQADTPGYGLDPLGESQSLACPGLLWKYAGRSLMLTTGACAVHCRFCFRRHARQIRHDDTDGDCRAWEPALDHIASERSIREVILSGGDPLVLPDVALARLAGRLSAIPHVSRVRVHTRMPIMIPRRVTDRLLAWLRGGRFAPVVVVHVNHAAEIDDAVAAGLERMVDAGIPVLSQTVLLRGVNDRLPALAELFERLVDLRVIPYYLHQLDPVAGAAHFAVPEGTGVELIAGLRSRLPGYAVPRYVRERPHAASKEPLA